MADLLAAGDRSPRLDKKDRKLLWLLTLVYTLFTLFNLGTLNFPQNAWTAEPGESVVLDLGEETNVSAVWFNGNIATGKMTVAADDGASYEYSQQFGEMFTWRKKEMSFTTRTLRLEVYSGEISLNEIAVLDNLGKPVAVSVAGGNGAALLDEQETVPEKASYYNGMIFDEIYHARTACEFLHNRSIYEWTHPPLGKELIAVGVALFGMTPFGWRVIPALFGAAMLPVMFLLGKRIFRRRDYAFLAAALFALDTMHFAQTRIATVDVFIVFFILLMYLFMLDYIEADNDAQPLKKTFLPLGACGVSFGLGVASKWTGLYAGVGLAVVFFTHLILRGIRETREGRGAAFWPRTIKTLAFCIGFFILIPGLIYFLSYIPFYRYEFTRETYAGGTGALDRLKEMVRILVSQQESMFSYHSKLTATHLCQSTWYEWPFTAKAVWFYFSSDGSRVSNISTFGSPAVWWVSAVGTLWLLMELIAGRMKQEPQWMKTAVAVVLAAVAANYFPWMTVPRCTFQYHFFPTAPFILLSALLLLRHLEETGAVPAWGKWCWLGVAAVYFLLLLPACSGLPMPRTYARFLEYVLPTGLLFLGAV